MLSSPSPVTCPHCKAVPNSAQAQFCGKCGKPLVVPPLPTTVLPGTAPQMPSPVSLQPTVQKWVPPRHASQVTSLAPQGAVSQAPAPKAPAPGSPLAVITPAFPAPITPAFNERPRRIFFACTASPIIGVGLGAEPAGLLAMWLVNNGLPEVLLPIFMTLGFVGVTALIAYIIMADKLALLGALVGRRKIESVEPIDAKPSERAELERAAESKGHSYAETSHQWAKQESRNKAER